MHCDQDLLPGTTVNAFGRGLEIDDLIRLVDDYNRQYAGRPFGAGTVLAREVTLPEEFALGDPFFTVDARLTHRFALGRRVTLTAVVDVFNLFNTANLVGYGGNLTNPETFGTPAGRFTQIFGSGGPRAIELGARFTF